MPFLMPFASRPTSQAELTKLVGPTEPTKPAKEATPYHLKLRLNQHLTLIYRHGALENGAPCKNSKQKRDSRIKTLKQIAKNCKTTDGE